MYRIYLRYPATQTVSNKTDTHDPIVAQMAFKRLLARTDLLGQNVAASMTLNGKNLMYVPFNAGQIDCDMPIRLHHDQLRLVPHE